MEWSKEPASFRDPCGFVFFQDGVLYRQVNQVFAPHYSRLIDSGLYAELIRDGLLVPHEEVPLRLPDIPAFAVLRPARIPFVSYPYEWCFSQYRAAALLTLELQRRAIAHGLNLRDASGFNVQFIGIRPVFIDTLSFGLRQDEPWLAYRQFCEHFLAPLALMSLAHPSLGRLGRTFLNGIPLAIAARLLPFRSFARPGLLTHIHFHARSAQHFEKTPAAQLTSRPTRMSVTSVLALVESLERTIANLPGIRQTSNWSNYTDSSNYSAAAQGHKQAVIAEWIQMLNADGPLVVWDLGANTGVYSRIAARPGNSVISYDNDDAVVERHFQECRNRQSDNILPLVQDIANPSPPTGWRHAERRALENRGPADVVLALALIHHLVISNNIPMPAVVDFLAAICRQLIIEFVPPEDSQLQRMLTFRRDVPEYSTAVFETSFRRRFEFVRSKAVGDTLRTLYLMRRTC